jgi:hypothetical protein
MNKGLSFDPAVLAGEILEITIRTPVLVAVARFQLRMVPTTMHLRGRNLELEGPHEVEQDAEVAWMNSRR